MRHLEIRCDSVTGVNCLAIADSYRERTCLRKLMTISLTTSSSTPRSCVTRCLIHNESEHSIPFDQGSSHAMAEDGTCGRQAKPYASHIVCTVQNHEAKW